MFAGIAEQFINASGQLPNIAQRSTIHFSMRMGAG